MNDDMDKCTACKHSRYLHTINGPACYGKRCKCARFIEPYVAPIGVPAGE